MTTLPPHRLEIVLVCPQIAPNTGNIARLAVATQTPLHLVRPLGFVLSDRQLRRSAMDYWPHLQLTLHDDLDSFAKAAAGNRLRLFSSKAATGLWEADLRDGDWLVFGNETHGLPAEFLNAHRDSAIRI
ncbi:MAG TPA: TrmH family RNA methyltransferase, partial [Tepidisphaeraceae bacterium]|nr:TrmH family RNA methyltransferase [Tepidisphaeraceae bacterium]